MSRIAVIDSGVANLASVVSALEAVGGDPFIAQTPEALTDASHLVLPGVGAFGPAIRSLRERGFDVAIRNAVAAGRPFLGICLGMQLLVAVSAVASPASASTLAASSASLTASPCPISAGTASRRYGQGRYSRAERRRSPTRSAFARRHPTGTSRSPLTAIPSSRRWLRVECSCASSTLSFLAPSGLA